MGHAKLGQLELCCVWSDAGVAKDDFVLQAFRDLKVDMTAHISSRKKTDKPERKQ